MQTITVTGAKGGVGTTTVATVLALQLAAKGHHVNLEGGEDTAAVLGLPGLAHARINDGLIFEPFGWLPGDGEPDFVVVDGATEDADLRILVVRNDYLALRAATRASGPAPDAIVLIEEPGRALTRSDVEAVLGQPVTVVPHRSAVARAVDAGVLASRLPEAFADLGRIVALARG